MAIKKQTVTFTVLFNDEETYAKSAADAIDHRLFNEDGVIEWDYKVYKEEELSVTVEDLEEGADYNGN